MSKFAASKKRRIVSQATRRSLFLEELENRRVFATGTVEFSSPTYAGTEAANITAGLLYTGDGPTLNDATATITLTPGSATALDFTPTPISVLIPAGTASGTTIPFDIPIVNDTLLEGNENLTADISLLVGGADTLTIGPNNTTDATILDDETATLMFVAPTSITVSESSGATNGNVELVITANGVAGAGALQDALTVPMNGDAGEGTDYTVPDLVLAPGTLSGTIPVPIAIINDATPEPTETFTITMGTPTGTASANVTPSGSLSLTITDDDIVGTVDVASPTFSGSETGAITGQLLYTGNGPTSDDATATVTLTPGTADATDFTVTPILVTIPAGTASGTMIPFSIPVTNDMLLEGDETFTAAVTVVVPPVGNVITTNGTTSTVTINDDETAVVSFAPPTSITAREGDPPVTGNVTIVITANGVAGTGTTQYPLTVPINSTPPAGTDYSVTDVVIPAATASGTTTPVPIVIVDDATPEPTENFVLSLGTATGQGSANVTSDPGTLALTINDNDIVGTVALSAATYSGLESSNITGQLVYTGNGPTTTDATATVALTPGTADATDFTVTPILVTIPAGTVSGAMIPFTIPVTNDTLLEGDENFTATLTGVVPGVGEVITTTAPMAATVTITDNETAVVSFAPPTSITAREGDGTVNGNVSIVITANGVAGTGSTQYPLTVPVNGNAGEGTDYTVTDVVIPAATASGTSTPVPIVIIDDATPEPTENFLLSLGAATGLGSTNVTSDPGTLALTINDNDIVGTVALAATTFSGTESTSITGQLVYMGNGPTTTDATATVTLTPGTADATDFTATPILVTIPAGTTSGTVLPFSIPVTNDTLLEGDETFTATLTAVAPGVGEVITTSGTPTATVTINDNETATLTFVAPTSITASESDGTVNGNLSLVITANGVPNSGTSQYALTVPINSTPPAGTDFTVADVVIPAGTMSGATTPVPIVILDDATPEPSESFVLSMGTVTGSGSANVTPSGTLALTITDNDTVGATGTIAFSQATYAYTEGANTGVFTGQLIYTGTTTTGAGSATITLTTGTAGAADFTATPVIVVIPAGTTTGQAIDFSVPVVNDTLLEGDESFTGQISLVTPGVGDTITAGGITSTTVTVNDNETATLTFAPATKSVGEAAGTVNATATLVITANGVANTGTLQNAMTVNFTDDAGANLSAGPVTLAAGTASGPVLVPITVHDDTVIEGNLTYHVSVGGVTGGGTITGANTLAVTVVDNDNIIIVNGQLRILGTKGNDVIIVTAINTTGSFTVLYNGSLLGTFTNKSLFVRAAAGNDRVLLRSAGPAHLQVRAVIIGGAGTDRLDASGNYRSSVLAGAAANDVLIGGHSRDILIGGSQTDTLRGNAGQDVLIGGAVSFQINDKALSALQKDWTAAGTVRARLTNMRTGAGPNLTAATVLDDRAVDHLLGGTGFDVFIEGPKDTDDAAAGEIKLRL